MKESQNNNSNIVSSENDVTLVDIYLILKRNRHVFLIVVIVGVLLSTAFAYYKHVQYTQNKNRIQKIIETKVGLKENKKHAAYHENIEYSLLLQIGSNLNIKSGKQTQLDSTAGTMAKLREIYIPLVMKKFNLEPLNPELQDTELQDTELQDTELQDNFEQPIIEVGSPGNTDLISLKTKNSKNKSNINYNDILISISKNILQDHSKFVIQNDKYLSTPTRIISTVLKTKSYEKSKKSKKPEVETKKVTKKRTSIYIMLGILLSVVFGLIAVYIREFLIKANEIEKLRQK